MFFFFSSSIVRLMLVTFATGTCSTAPADTFATVTERNASEAKKQADAGIQTITLTTEEGQRYRKIFYDTVWETMAQKSPQHTAKLKELLVR